jgi:murein DD-endopeptidase MepM/ murein hydrolase activator NlpD
MKPPFAVLLVHGDGSRAMRFRVPRAIIYGALGLVGGMVGFSAVYVVLQAGELAALRRRADGQREVIDAYQARVGTVRGEIVAWRALHDRMAAAVAAAPGAKSTSGAGTAAALAAAAPIRPAPWAELDLLTRTVAEEGPRLREIEQAVRRTGDLIQTLPLRWPVRGPIKSQYGVRQSPWTGKAARHEGVDIGSAPGTPVASPARAKVIRATFGPDYGRHVVLDHGNGVRSLYGHLKQLDVKAGQQVETGHVLGLVGSSGKATGPHLHYEVLVDGRPVDPRPFLAAR